jgi:hypothetical protein
MEINKMSVAGAWLAGDCFSYAISRRELPANVAKR